MITVLQVIVSVVLIGLVLIQERSGGVSGGIFGGGSGAPYQTRRGVERFIFIGTIAAAIVFLALAILNLVF